MKRKRSSAEDNIKPRNMILAYGFLAEAVISAGAVIYAAIAMTQPTAEQARMVFVPPFSAGMGMTMLIAFMFFSAVALCLIALLARNRVAVLEIDQILCLALFIFLSAIWMMFVSGIPRESIDNVMIREMVTYFSFYLMPIPFMFFARISCTHNQAVFDGVIALFELNYAVNFIWLWLNSWIFPPTLFVEHILLILAIAACLAVSVTELKKHKNREVCGLLIGITVMAILVPVDLLYFYYNPEAGFTQHFGVGIIVFVLILSIRELRKLIDAISLAQSFEVIASSISCGLLRAKNDENLTIVYANDALFRLYGYASAREAAADGFSHADGRLFPEEAAAINAEVKAQFARGIRHIELETKETNRQGETVWMLNWMDYLPQTDEIICTIFDITERKAMEEQLRIREEEFRIAIAQSDKQTQRYDIATQTIHQSEHAGAVFGLGTVVENVPEAIIQSGIIAPESVPDYVGMYEAMQRGVPSGTARVRMRSAEHNAYHWYQGDYTLIFDRDGQPTHGILSFYDITEQRDKELAYAKWRQELAALPQQKTAIFEWNLTRDVSEGESGELIKYFKNLPIETFDERTQAYAVSKVFVSDRPAYLLMLNRERLIGAFYEGVSSHEMDYRELQAADSLNPLRWMHLTIQLVGYPDSGEIKAYLIIRDIDEEKRKSLDIITRSREDALTGVLNRAAFTEEIDALLSAENPEPAHAFVMLDIDRFKQVNDVLGHAEGDRLLISIAGQLKAVLREGDLICRIGGDEFMLCLKNIPSDEVVAKRAALICQLLNIPLRGNIAVSGSVGVAMCPRDGSHFDLLYRQADAAMYHAKKQGGNRYVFYRAEMALDGRPTVNTPIDEIAPAGV